MKRFKGISLRHPTWDYKRAAKYFITIKTKNRIRYFGEIKDHKMILSEIGSVAQTEWMKIPSIRPDMNIELDEFVVMPDHIHGIIIIRDNEYNSLIPSGDTMHCVPSGKLKTRKGTFGPQRKNLSSIIRGYKSAVTTFARKNNIEFSWQSLYHDHIIRDYIAFCRIKDYIVNNPSNWKEK
jgi:REP element-mobilizing transposase RayT